MPDVRDWPRPDWTPVPREGASGVETRVLSYTEGTQLLAQLRFDVGATIDEHDAPHPIDVYCLEGSGYTSVAGEAAPIAAGQHIRWPAHELHRLWTEGERMVTLMHEHLEQATTPPASPRTS